MKKKIGFLMGVLLLLILPSTAFADYWAVGNVGIKAPNSSYKDYPGSTPMPKDCFVQYIWTKNGYIDGPTGTGGRIDPNDTLVFTERVGYNPVEAVDPGAGRFFYCTDRSGLNSVPADVNKFFVRMWWRSDTGGADSISNCDRFGEGVYYFPGSKFISTDDPKPTPDDFEIGNVYAVLPTQAPAEPSPAAASSTRGSGTTVPTITVIFSSKLGTRYFEIELYRDDQYTDQYGSTVKKYWDNNWHAAPVNDGTSDRTQTFSLTTNDDKRYFYWRVRAVNSFGPSDWVTGNVWVEENADPYIPVAITDLRAVIEDGSTKLSWTAPYDKDKRGVVAACGSYDVRVFDEAIVDVPQDPFSPSQTNPQAISNWDSATSITAFFTSSPAIQAPEAFGTAQEITIDYVPTRPLFFAIKSEDASGNTSYLSNVAGVGLGGGVVAPLRFTLQPSSDVKLVVNSISIPYDLVDGQGDRVTDAEGLINLINAKSEDEGKIKDNVIVIGKWDPIIGAVGLKPDGEGTNFGLVPGEGYQLYVEEGFELVLP